MPNHEEHCQDSYRKNGKRYDDVHTWMDAPSQVMGGSHRAQRHDPYRTPNEARSIFGEGADHACLDHILLDARESLESKTEEEQIDSNINYEDLDPTSQSNRLIFPYNILNKYKVSYIRW